MTDIGSLFLYGITFLVSILIASMLEKQYCFNLGKCELKNIADFTIIIFACLPLVILSTFRYGVGVDYFSYYDDYIVVLTQNYSLNDFDFEMKEVGYTFITWLAINVFDSYRGLLFLSAWLTTVPVLIALLKYKRQYIVIGWSIYIITLYISSFNGIRQHIAVSIIMLALVYFYKNKLLKGLICTFIAYLFHYTALIALAFPLFIKCSRMSRKTQLIVLIGVFSLGILCMGLLMKILENVPLIYFYLDKYSGTFDDMSLMHYISNLAFKFPLVVLMICYYKKLIFDSKYNFALLAFLLLDMMFVFGSYYIKWIIRLQYYTMLAYPLVIVNIISNKSISNRKIILWLFIVWILIRFVLWFGVAHYDSVIPYDYSFDLI
ncbi:EpsG family protein [Selenomonas montiformis]|uniref:EpsG family protein n=1 Tax=Selenomonas montiformis TaxID=2652285 RepID=UPI0039F5A873